MIKVFNRFFRLFFSNALLISIIVLNIIINLFQTIKGKIVYDIDIARDFLLIDQIISTQHPTLIGARTAIDGVFHGPFWLYLNLPIFFLSKGNPITISWFWLFLFLLLLLSVYTITIKIADKKSALIACTLLSTQGVFFIKSPTNPFGAFLLYPFFLYFFFNYVSKHNKTHLALSIFLLGFIIQSEIVFGLPIFFLSILFVIFIKKQIKDLLLFTLILIPLSSYIVFDTNHSMLQATSLLRFITQKGSYSHFVNILIDRIFGFFSYSIQLFSYHPVNEKTSSILCTILNFLISCFFIFFIFKQRSHTKRINQNILYLSIYFYFGFWFLTLFTSQTIHWYYYFPFLTVTIICFAITISKFSHNIVYPIILLIVGFNMMQGLKTLQYSDKNSSSWEFHHNLAKHIFKDSPKQFGYYINTFDQISSYLPMYAMKYTQKQFSQTRSYSLEKKPITYLIIGSYPDNKPLDNNWWKKERVRITKEPLEKIVYKNGFVVEKYFLNDTELKTQADTTIFQTLQYR